MTPEEKAAEAQRVLRDELVRTGVLTQEQAQHVSMRLVPPGDYPGVRRCDCEQCQKSPALIALEVDEAKFSRLQIMGIAQVYNQLLGPFIPAPSDPEKWNGGRRVM